MTLHDYMKLANIKDAEFSDKIGKDRSAVTKYRLGLITPPLEVIAEIEKATSGAVSFRDFLQKGAA
jgi:transcriptional regulator with XRE-family HTH domain